MRRVWNEFKASYALHQNSNIKIILQLMTKNALRDLKKYGENKSKLNKKRKCLERQLRGGYQQEQIKSPPAVQSHRFDPSNNFYENQLANNSNEPCGNVLQVQSGAQRLDSLLSLNDQGGNNTAPQPPERGSSFTVMSQTHSVLRNSSNTLTGSGGSLGVMPTNTSSTLKLSDHGHQGVGTATIKRVSFHDPNANQQTQSQTIEQMKEDPNHFINEAEGMLSSPKSPDSGSFLTNTPGVIGAQEVYKDPRTRMLAQQQQQKSTRAGPLPEKLSFKEKMKMFAMETGENGTPRDKVCPRSPSFVLVSEPNPRVVSFLMDGLLYGVTLIEHSRRDYTRVEITEFKHTERGKCAWQDAELDLVLSDVWVLLFCADVLFLLRASQGAAEQPPISILTHRALTGPNPTLHVSKKRDLQSQGSPHASRFLPHCSAGMMIPRNYQGYPSIPPDPSAELVCQSHKASCLPLPGISPCSSWKVVYQLFLKTTFTFSYIPPLKPHLRPSQSRFPPRLSISALMYFALALSEAAAASLFRNLQWAGSLRISITHQFPLHFLLLVFLFQYPIALFLTRRSNGHTPRATFGASFATVSSTTQSTGSRNLWYLLRDLLVLARSPCSLLFHDLFPTLVSPLITGMDLIAFCRADISSFAITLTLSPVSTGSGSSMPIDEFLEGSPPSTRSSYIVPSISSDCNPTMPHGRLSIGIGKSLSYEDSGQLAGTWYVPKFIVAEIVLHTTQLLSFHTSVQNHTLTACQPDQQKQKLRTASPVECRNCWHEHMPSLIAAWQGDPASPPKFDQHCVLQASSITVESIQGPAERGLKDRQRSDATVWFHQYIGGRWLVERFRGIVASQPSVTRLITSSTLCVALPPPIGLSSSAARNRFWSNMLVFQPTLTCRFLERICNFPLCGSLLDVPDLKVDFLHLAQDLRIFFERVCHQPPKFVSPGTTLLVEDNQKLTSVCPANLLYAISDLFLGDIFLDFPENVSVGLAFISTDHQCTGVHSFRFPPLFIDIIDFGVKAILCVAISESIMLNDGEVAIWLPSDFTQYVESLNEFSRGLGLQQLFQLPVCTVHMQTKCHVSVWVAPLLRKPLNYNLQANCLQYKQGLSISHKLTTTKTNTTDLPNCTDTTCCWLDSRTTGPPKQNHPNKTTNQAILRAAPIQTLNNNSPRGLRLERRNSSPVPKFRFHSHLDTRRTSPSLFMFFCSPPPPVIPSFRVVCFTV
uniref:Uncharacterized protein n=1 Tax=Timema shepardi TaxID=629360 RepID=A0A7R9ATB4_TIMSH|nr:unnamed protein product [Timema shepardi]